jgi:hypothetical protein
MVDERLFTCSACGQVRPRSELVRVGEAFACHRDDPTCARWLRRETRAQKRTYTKRSRELFKLGGR